MNKPQCSCGIHFECPPDLKCPERLALQDGDSEYAADVAEARGLVEIYDSMHNGDIREAQLEAWYGSSEFNEKERALQIGMALCMSGVLKYVDAQAERIASLERENAAAVGCVYAVWRYEYDAGETVGIYLREDAAEAVVHSLAQQYNATKCEDQSPMKAGRTKDGLLAYSDKSWNHRVGVTRHTVNVAAAPQAPADAADASGVTE